MFGSFSRQQKWLIAMATNYLLGHVGCYLLIRYLYPLELLVLVPPMFTLIPMVGISFGFKSKLFSKKCEYPRVTIYLMFVYIGTWACLAWLYAKNVFPMVLWREGVGVAMVIFVFVLIIRAGRDRSR